MNSIKLNIGLCLIVICSALIAQAQPANDNVCSATTLTVNGVASCHSTLNATAVSDPSYGCGVAAATVWFKFTSPASGSVKISTDNAGTNFNTIIALFSSASCSGPFTEIGCNDNGNQVNVASSSDLNLSCLTPFEIYYVMVDGAAGATGTVCISLTNNGGTALGADFSCGFGANSPGLPILPVTGTVSCFSNKCAGFDAGEPAGNSWSDAAETSIWMIFIAPTSGSVLITTDHPGTTLNNQIAVYRTACPYFSAVQINSDEGSGASAGTSEMLVCGLNPGGSYWIQVDGVAADTGTVCISVRNVSVGNRAAGSDTICGANTIAVNGTVSAYHNICATTQGGEPFGNNWKIPDVAEKTTWHKFVAPTNGKITVSTDHAQTNFDTEIAVYSSSDGTCSGTLSEEGSDDDSGSGITSLLSLSCLIPGTTYFIQVDGYLADTGDYGISIVNDTGSVATTNDSLCDAIFLDIGTPVSISNLCAHAEAGDASPSCFSVENSVYFMFSPPESGNMSLSFTNATFSLEYAVFEILDSICSDTINLTEITCDNISFLSFTCLNPFSSYLLLVDGVASAEGSFDIELVDDGGARLGPDNVCQGAALNLPLNSSINVISNSCAGVEIGEPVPPAGSSGTTPCTSQNGWCDTEPPAVQNSVWATFRPSFSGYATITTDNDNTDFDTQLAIWETGDCGDFSGFALLAANDNCPGGCNNIAGDPSASTVSLCVDSGKLYFIQLDGFGGATGNAGLSGSIVPLNASAGNDTTVCFGDNITLTATGGAQYLWSTGATTASITVSPGILTTYVVTITTPIGCVIVDGVKVTVDYTTPPANAGNDTSTCKFVPVTLTATGGGGYLWSTGETTASITVSPLINTPYIVTVTGPNGCTLDDAVNVTVKQLPLVNAGNDTTVCIGSGASLTATGGASYVWSTGATTTSIQVFPSADSTFSVTATGANGCTASDNITVHVTSFPAFDLGNDTAICTGSSVTLSATGGGTYLWSTGNTGASIVVSPLVDSLFRVTVTSASGCTAEDEIIITVNTAPVANAGADTSICLGDSIILIASGGTNYLWNTGETTSSIKVSPPITVIYSVTVSHAIGCFDTDDVAVTVKTRPIANAGTDVTICKGQIAGLSASNGTGFTFLWSTGETSRSIDVSPLSSTTYFVTVTNSSGCSDIDDVMVSVFPDPVLSVSDDTVVCVGSSVDLSVSGGVSYLWNTGETANKITVAPNSLSVYTVRTTDINGCIKVDTIIVAVVLPPTADAGNDADICLGDDILFIASGGTSYLWSTGQTTASITVSPLVTTDYEVQVFNSNGCMDRDSVTVTVKSLPIVNVPDTSVCFGESALLDAGNTGTSYLWSTGETTQIITVSVAGTYSARVTGNNGCTGIDTVTVSNFPLIMSNLSDQNICGGTAVVLDAGNTGSSYLWSTGETSQTITVTDSGAYSVTITDVNGCSLVDNSTIGVSALPIVDAGANDTICQGETATLTASGGVSYQWNTGATTAVLNISPVSTSPFTVTVTDINGCSASDSALVFVNDLPNVTLSLDTLYCINAGTRILSGGNPPGGNYSGNGVSGTTFDPVVAGLGAHVITYSFTDSNSCTDTAQFSVLVDLCTGTALAGNEFGINVFPNPFLQEIRVVVEAEKSEQVYLRLFDVIGKTVAEKRTTVVKGTNSLYLQPDVSNGVYFLELRIDGKIYPFKLSRFY